MAEEREEPGVSPRARPSGRVPSEKQPGKTSWRGLGDLEALGVVGLHRIVKLWWGSGEGYTRALSQALEPERMCGLSSNHGQPLPGSIVAGGLEGLAWIREEVAV